MSRRYSLLICFVILIPFIVLLLIGTLAPALKGASGATFGWLSAGLFSGGLLSAGLFSAGIYSAGLFSVGVFSSGVFSVGVVSFGTYTIGIWSCGQYPVGVYTKQLESAHSTTRVFQEIAGERRSGSISESRSPSPNDQARISRDFQQ